MQFARQFRPNIIECDLRDRWWIPNVWQRWARAFAIRHWLNHSIIPPTGAHRQCYVLPNEINSMDDGIYRGRDHHWWDELKLKCKRKICVSFRRCFHSQARAHSTHSNSRAWIIRTRFPTRRYALFHNAINKLQSFGSLHPSERSY